MQLEVGYFFFNSYGSEYLHYCNEMLKRWKSFVINRASSALTKCVGSLATYNILIIIVCNTVKDSNPCSYIREDGDIGVTSVGINEVGNLG